jgi:hypothetical protein
MKKSIFIVLLFLGFSKLSTAQTQLTVNVDKDICLTKMSVTLSDQSEHVIETGCAGTYEFSFSSDIDHLTINGVDCYKGTLTRVTVDDNKAASSKVIVVGNTIVDDLNGLIR